MTSSYLNFFKEFLQKKEGPKSSSGATDDDEYDNKSTYDTSVNNPGTLKTVVVGGNCSGSGNIGSSSSGAIAGTGTGTEVSSPASSKMEYNYMRDKIRSTTMDIVTGLTPTRTILVRRTPPCCHTQPAEEPDMDESNQAIIPSYNEIGAKEVMNECARIANYVRNNNSDDEDWESKVDQTGWTNMKRTLFLKVARLLDSDQLGRLANSTRQNEAMQRRAIVDKSADRMRKALASIAWDSRLTQWLHCLLMDSLPPTYMASYLDILQTLKGKLPALMDKMLFSRPLNISQELLAPVMKRQWEPEIIGGKSRKLSKEAVIVALPSMPTSGPVPKRLQKWYQHMATITQIVQITLPMTSGQATRQPLELVAEQIVSLTRVKIQDLRNESAQRSIILVGFNAGAALALQVAMSENIACVVCMGFAYNTFNGVRGMPDDRLLDIKIPILFVIGQNSARSSQEELEALREKMQSETSLVVVGSADDVLRIPKSRRRIENVTQAMVDTMVVDEIFEFVQRTLNNPPGPRVPTSMTSTVYQKHNKATGVVVSAGSGGVSNTLTPQQRKRKLEGGTDDPLPVKTKFVPHIGRPRTRPMPITAKGTTIVSRPNGSGKKGHLSPNSITNEDLNMAIQSILNDSPDMSGSAQQSTSMETGNSAQSPKILSNIELLNSKVSVPPKNSTLLNSLVHHKSTAGTATITGAPTKIKMIPTNQFVQLKPPLQSQSKIYTIKTASMLNQPNVASAASIGSIVSTNAPSVITKSSPQQQIFTLKSATGQTTQYVTAAPVGSQQKYTVVKNAAGGTSVQLTKVGGGVVGVGMAGGATTKPQLDLNNIIDMPIVFADGDGNISDSMGSESMKTSNRSTMGTSGIVKSGSSGQLIISQKIIKEANSPIVSTAIPTTTKGGTYIISKSIGSTSTVLQSATSGSPSTSITPSLGKPNKVVFINRSNMKPCSNINPQATQGTQPLSKYAKVLVTNPKISTPTIVHRTGSTPIVSTVKQMNLQTLNSSTPTVAATSLPGGVLNVGSKSYQIVNAGDKQSIPNIVVKPGGLRQIPPHLKNQLFNRNLTVRKLVNIVPPKTMGASVTITPTTGPIATSTASTTSNTGSTSSSAIQSLPKIITFNSLNSSSSSASAKASSSPPAIEILTDE